MFRRLGPITLAAIFALNACTATGEMPVRAQRVIATPQPTAHAEVNVDVVQAAPAPTPAATRLPAPRRTPAPATPANPAPVAAQALAGGNTGAFRGLGTWVDVFDYKDDPADAKAMVADIHARGVRTLYLETSRATSQRDIDFPNAVGAALDEAKARAMRVVAWYPPALDDVARDVRRTVVAVRFTSPGGHNFDGFASDIEYTSGVPDHAERNARLMDYTRRVRAEIGTRYPLAAITIAPTSLELNPNRWRDFPWSELAPHYDVFMPMNYWTGRSTSPQTATELTVLNTTKSAALTGKPVHNIGGLGAQADEAQTVAYVQAIKASGSIGGGLYDYRTTRAEVWDELRALN